ncbi:hypothetical protein GCM10009734_69000 [Nonomuraea bangladeshensis]
MPSGGRADGPDEKADAGAGPPGTPLIGRSSFRGDRSSSTHSPYSADYGPFDALVGNGVSLPRSHP